MVHTLETRKKLSEMRTGEKNPFFGKKHTPEMRKHLAKMLRSYTSKRTYDITAPTVQVPKSKHDLAYLAGIIDGEGSIRYRSKRPFIGIYNGSESLKEWLREHTGIDPRWTDFRGRVPGWQWIVQSASNVYVLCVALAPWLIVKRGEADDVIANLESKYGKRLTKYHGAKH